MLTLSSITFVEASTDRINCHDYHHNPSCGVLGTMQGGAFDFVSGANFFGEILEWAGYAVAAWSLPAGEWHAKPTRA